MAQATSQNEKLTFTLQQAKEQLAALRDEVEKLTQPPAAYGTFLGVVEDGTVDVFSERAQDERSRLHPDIDPGIIRKGDEVVLNESLNVVLAVRDGELSGEVVTLWASNWRTSGAVSCSPGPTRRRWPSCPRR